ncbi:MAG: hypothetical protein RQ826_15440 [Xanthomonadales bacterium]|nr:hypothetical protein [Xanthomonadales bacterium]
MEKLLETCEMSPNRQKPVVFATVSTLIYGAAQLVDLASTYLLSPGLAREANILVQRFGLGWPGLILMAALFTALMFLAQNWAWGRLFRRLPDTPTAYKSLYGKLLREDPEAPAGTQAKSDVIGLSMGVVLIVAYAAIASKLMAVAWNISLLWFAAEYPSPWVFRLIKGAVAAAFGLVMFFVVPYWLHRRSMRR